MDSNIVNKKLLDEKIAQLEKEYAYRVDVLKESYQELTVVLKPSNIMGSALKSVVRTPGLKATFIDTIISAGAGIIGKKVVVRNSGSIFRKIAGLATQFILTNVVRNKIPEVMSKNNGQEKHS